ncbi:AfsR/SARP family transcriptional regulator [Pseudarthrobacter sp. NS4]|uniref:AfsR/SARP family transcriptional regulator n=1 Tax=Pseudarthrobacter sp. NS4 TaxID=2973976 RepID=UPI0021624562|nr:BTAD domain-containing putative transcriptional regulator [Pseudarthrobacter sp. NS4]
MGNDDGGILELDLMGSWQIRREGRVVHVAARQQRLIAALAVHGASLRNYLAGMLWPDYPDAKALESLRVAVHLMTRQVPGLLVKDGALLSLDNRVAVDLHRVRALLKDAAVANTGTTWTLLRDLRDLDFLPGWYEDWVLFEQSRLRHDLLRAFTLVSRQFAAGGDHEAAAEAAVAALEIEPLYESAVRVLVTSELAQGNLAAALLAYDKYQERLLEDMGVRPSEGLRQLINGIIRSPAPAA